METLYVTNRRDWRTWLEKHYTKEKEIWLVYYRKASGKPRIPYNDAVEEALCFGWIDSTLKGIDEETYGQRFSRRRAGSSWSQMNLERARRLIEQGKMKPVGLLIVRDLLKNDRVEIASDILAALKKDKKSWTIFQDFPDSYKRIRIGFIEMARNRPDELNRRLRYFLKMTARNKKFGMVQ